MIRLKVHTKTGGNFRRANFLFTPVPMVVEVDDMQAKAIRETHVLHVEEEGAAPAEPTPPAEPGERKPPHRGR